jgi:hypothetical protein
MEGKPYIVTYCDVIYANSEKEAYKILLRQLESDVACREVGAFNIKPIEELKI